MPKRKSIDPAPPQPPPLSSLDAALDLLVCDTFTRLDSIAAKFEACAAVKLNDGVVHARWEEAVKRYWVMKSMDELTCSAEKNRAAGGNRNGYIGSLPDGEDGVMEDAENTERDGKSRPMPTAYPGAVSVHNLAADEEDEWRKWNPRLGNVVLVDTAHDGIWPGKIIDKKAFFQGRTTPRGNHFFPVRIYNEFMPPIISIKARLIPFHLRPEPPLLASASLQSAYHHAKNPGGFDVLATAREAHSARTRLHPGVTGEDNQAKYKGEREEWNTQVNWVMSERRMEKLRILAEERGRVLREVGRSASTPVFEANGESSATDERLDSIFGVPKKRRTSLPPPKPKLDPTIPALSIVPSAPSTPPPRTAGSPSMASYIRPSLSNQRTNSPRRTPTRRDRDKRMYALSGVGELSPAASVRRTYTPPRILPSGDETAPSGFGMPEEVKSGRFDFTSPLGPVKMGKLVPVNSKSNAGGADGTPPGKTGRSGSLEIVREEDEEEGWSIVSRKCRRAGSEPAGARVGLPLGEQGQGESTGGAEDMEL
ncbi:hypothetical protein L198_05033 [Cryptococcus wingfieldii CBS 7118]|uniref:Uncharacterized protein n=1 Tax=Cryptococcus wingfieldii CBS 7118 TaxID=1295528 RepID=A0A1E3J043_9TREE|nr:hypothetical protein L198_05033 [Cryptococcus wingfieldii CBS 7118]ODN94182.1 hypothetical protein L198_05033 [Cryptococcus wingfieldii CBS 7118]